ncbi:uncharacterized protein LOC133958675 [Platichthys flesus]|uniref:uncharacterized protein LOC133958675 n=1 Tax=Platichthys flesus TaxID=8260 RepID=UPI002DB80891|nr:uncharacterized protein LOC133958675 [Platichthys flesus]
MAARSRITVLLLIFLLSTEHSFAVNVKELAPLVNELLSGYRFNSMFSLAVSIPLNQDQNKNQNQNQNQNHGANQIIQEVLKSDHADNVKNKINKGEVYIGSRVVAAEVRRLEKGSDHAESRVVNNLDQLVNSPQVNNNDLLLFYVYASPCVEKCTSYGHTENILKKINRIRHWKSYAVVFSKIFKPKKGQENTKEERIDALERLAWYKVGGGHIGLENIFRCDRTKQSQKLTMQCISCSSNGNVAHKCVSDDPPSATSQSEASASTKMCPQSARGGSSSESGAQDESEWRSVNRRGGRVRRDISCSVEDVSSPQIGLNSGDGNGKVSRGKGKVSKGKGSKGRRGKGRKGKGRRGKGGKGKGRRRKGGKGKGRRRKGGKGKGRRGKGGKGKGSRRGGRSRRRGLDQE